jgi:hypothetical protein
MEKMSSNNVADVMPRYNISMEVGLALFTVQPPDLHLSNKITTVRTLLRGVILIYTNYRVS